MIALGFFLISQLYVNDTNNGFEYISQTDFGQKLMRKGANIFLQTPNNKLKLLGVYKKTFSYDYISSLGLISFMPGESKITIGLSEVNISALQKQLIDRNTRTESKILEVIKFDNSGKYVLYYYLSRESDKTEANEFIEKVAVFNFEKKKLMKSATCRSDGSGLPAWSLSRQVYYEDRNKNVISWDILNNHKKVLAKDLLHPFLLKGKIYSYVESKKGTWVCVESLSGKRIAMAKNNVSGFDRPIL
jgi:hypothetical protein